MQSPRSLLSRVIKHASKQLSLRTNYLSKLPSKPIITDTLCKQSLVGSFHFRNLSTPAIKTAPEATKATVEAKTTAAAKVETSEKPLDPPLFEGEEKVYTVKVKKLVDEISQLTLLEVTEFSELLKKTLKISDLPVMQATAAPAVQKEDEEEVSEVQQAKSSFTVRILKFETSKKVALIKEVKNIVPGMNLVQAKKFVESVPSVVGTDISREDAEKLKETLTAVGAFVEIE